MDDHINRATQPDSAARHRAIFESAIDFAIIATDVQGRVTDWNTGAFLILGWTADEMQGRCAERFFTPEDRADDVIEKEMATALATGRGDDERWHLRKDGSLFWASGEMMPLRDADGSHIGFIKILRDRTAERIEAVKRAADAEFMRGVLAASNDCIKVLDLDARLEFMSEGGQRVMEVSDFDALRGCSWPDFWQGGSKSDVEAAVFAARQGGSGRFQGQANTAAGRPRYWDVQVTPIPGPDGRPERLLSISRDITELHESESAIKRFAQTLERRIEERTRERDRAWKFSRDLQLVIDTGGVVHTVNAVWTSLLGWTAEELVGRSFVDFLHPDDQAPTQAALAFASDEVPPPFENRCRHKRGAYYWIAWVANPDDGLIYASGRNIAAEREAAASLEATQEQLRQSQKMEAVGQLTGGLAHDFNNLLASITGSLALMSRRLAQGRVGELERYIGVAKGSAQRAASLTHRMLAFSRRQTLEPKPTEVGKLIVGMEDLVRRTIGPEIALEVVGTAGAWNVNIDPHQLENALLNLCINARDAMPNGGRLAIETANESMDERAALELQLSHGQYLSICVTDTGTGMDGVTLKRIFEPFYTTKPMGLGTGLGLSMVYGFAVQSGGQVRAWSEPGVGTKMCIYLPRFHGEVSEAPVRETASAVETGLDRGTILVVDDEAQVRAVVSEVLVDLGFATVEAEDGAQGLAALRSGMAFEMMITDVGLPGGLNGRQLADAGRMLQPALKVLFITGYAENAVLGNGHLEPGMAILTKPFDLDALAAKVAELV